MSNTIWKTDGLREASTKKLILYFAGGSRIPYTGWNHPDIMMLSASNESWWNYTDVMRWCYVDDLIAQADKAERLEIGLEDIKNQLEYRACLECKHCNQQLNAIEILKDVEQLIKENQ